MSELTMAQFLSYGNAKPVAGVGSVLQIDGGFKRHIRSRLEQALLEERDVPLLQVFGRHGQFARGKQPVLALLRGRTERPQRVTKVARGVAGRKLCLVSIGDAGHTQGLEDALAQKLQ